MSTFALTGVRGDTLQFDVSVTLNGSIVDISGCLLWFTGKYSMSDADPGVFQVRSDGSNTYGLIAFTDPNNGKAQITLNPSATQSLSPNQLLVCDLQFRDSGGKITTVASGTLQFTGDVTTTTT